MPCRSARVLEKHPAIELEAVQTAFRSHFIDRSGHFDKSLLHFLLNQLARHKDDMALPTAIAMLRTNAEETEAALKYISALPGRGKVARRLRKILAKKWEDRYYQQYEVCLWFLRNFNRVGSKTLRACRRLVSSSRHPDYVRNAAKEVIAKFGGPDEFEAVRESFHLDHDDEARSLSLLAIARQDSTRRNAFFKKHESGTGLLRKAIELAKSG